MSRQQSLADALKIRAFKIVFTFPEELFPNGAHEDQYQDVVWRYLAQMGMTSRLVNTEYGDGGDGDNPHFDIVCACPQSNTIRLDNLKRTLQQITGFSVREVTQMSDALKKHWIDISELKFPEDFENCINYCIKEGRAKERSDGLFTETFIQEAARRGEDRKGLKRYDKLIYVRDKGFLLAVATYMRNLPLAEKTTNLDKLIPNMIRDGYSFLYIRRWRYLRMHWELVEKESRDYYDEKFANIIW